MINQLEGRLVKACPEVRGESARGPWVRMEFVMETIENYPRTVALTVFGEEKVSVIKQIAVGTQMVVSFSPESREYNGRYYTSLNCIAIMSIGAQPMAAQYPQQPQYAPPAPQQYAAPAPQQQYVTPQQALASQPSLFHGNTAPAAAMPANDNDDLPF